MAAADPPTRRPGALRFVGRTSELAALEEDLRQLPHPLGPWRVLRGPAGVGKTRLAEELARRAQRGGTTVVWGHSPGESTAPPYWPWTQVVRSLLGRTTGTDLALLALGQEGPVDRFELFDAVTGIVRRAAAHRPLLVVLDDLHSADQATMQLTRFLVRHLGDAPVLVVATVRAGEHMGDALAENLEALRRFGGELTLGGLTVEAVGELLADGSHAEPVHSVTGGNPLHVHQLLRVLDPLGGGDGADAVPDLGAALRETVRQRVRSMTPRDRAVLDRAAVLGPVFDLRELTLLAEPFDPLEVAAAVTSLDSEGMVTDTDPGRFCHPLIAEVVHEEIEEPQRQRLHHMAATVIGDDPDRIGEVAHHLLQAGGEHRHDAVELSRRAGATATAAAAHEDAVVHLTHAIEVIDGEADGPLRLEVLLELGSALWRAGRNDDADRAYDEAWEQAVVLGDPYSLARAVLRNGVEYYFADTRPGLRERAEAALAAQPPEPSATRARLLAELATGHLARDLPLSQDLADRAVAMARDFDDEVALGNALIARQVSDLGPSTLTRRTADSHEILACARRSGDYRLAVHGRFLLMVALLEAGDISGLDGELLRYDGMTEELGEPRYERFALWLRATRAMLEGDVRSAQAFAEQTFEMSGRLGDPDAFGVYGGQLGVVLWMQGRALEMEPVYAAMRASEPHEPLWPSVLAWLSATDGRADAARGALAAIPDPATIPGGMHWLLTATTYAEVAAMVGTGEQVDTAWNALVPYADRVVPVAMGAAVWGTVAKPLGHLAIRRGRVDEGIAYLRTAVRTCARLGARPWLIDAQLDLADALVEHRPGDPEAASLRAEASAAAKRLGLDLFLDRLEAAGAPAPMTPPPPPAVVPEGSGGERSAAPADGERSGDEADAHPAGRPQVRVVGGFEVVGLDGTTARWSSRKARELLKILVSRRGAPIHRETLMDMLWPDDDPAVLANRLSVALSTVRGALDPARTLPPGDLVSTGFDSVALDLEVVDVDVEHLLEESRTLLARVRSSDVPPGPDVVEEAVALLEEHRGEALPDEPHAEWAVTIRDEVRTAMVALARLVAEEAERTGDHLRAVEAHLRILDIDPYDEGSNLGLTAAYSAMGAHGQAEAAYSGYRARMAELGVPVAERPTG